MAAAVDDARQAQTLRLLRRCCERVARQPPPPPRPPPLPPPQEQQQRKHLEHTQQHQQQRQQQQLQQQQRQQQQPQQQPLPPPPQQQQQQQRQQQQQSEQHVPVAAPMPAGGQVPEQGHPAPARRRAFLRPPPRLTGEDRELDPIFAHAGLREALAEARARDGRLHLGWLPTGLGRVLAALRWVELQLGHRNAARRHAFAAGDWERLVSAFEAGDRDSVRSMIIAFANAEFVLAAQLAKLAR